MWSEPNPILNEKEQELLGVAPEECLRRVVARRALSLDQVTEGLSPRLAAVVRSVATGERIPDSPARGLTRGIEPEGAKTGADFNEIRRELERKSLSVYPRLLHLVDEQRLTIEEAYDVAHSIDYALGRYLTGTRYAAP